MTNFELKICFSKSGSKFYEQVIHTASSVGKFTEGEPNILVLNKRELLNNLPKIGVMVTTIKRWRSTKFYLNNEPIDWHYFINNFLVGINCYKAYQEAVIQENYCWTERIQPGWGCKQLWAIKRYIDPYRSPWREQLYWWEIGCFITDTTWQVDKKEIKRLLKRESELKNLKLCPIFDFNKVAQSVEELPDAIDTKEESWEVECSKEPGESNKPIRIRPAKSDPYNWS